jgi:hypothetical protein
MMVRRHGTNPKNREELPDPWKRINAALCASIPSRNAAVIGSGAEFYELRNIYNGSTIKFYTLSKIVQPGATWLCRQNQQGGCW